MAQAFQVASKQVSKALRAERLKIRSRVNIVSPQLCDDALGRLLPSLRKYEGCTIIDINPGVGLWSSKIHDVVRPRKHILAEPSSSAFASALEPLIKQKDSRYHLVDWPQMDTWTPDRYVAEGLLPALHTHDPKKPNRSILILANTAVLTHKGHPPKTLLKLMDWANDITSGSGFYVGGPVRVLLWCPEKDAIPVLPRTIRYRSKLSLLLEMTCHIEEIVGSRESVREKQTKRDQAVELESAKRVAKNMQKSGITVPLGRETDLHEQVQEALAQSESKDTTREMETTPIRARSWHQELQALRQKFKDVDLALYKGKRRMANAPPNIAEDPAYARFIELERNLKHVQKRTGVIEELLQEQSQIDALDLQAHDPNRKESQRTATLAEIQNRKEVLQERIENLGSQTVRDEYEFFKHERKAYAQNPPLLMWDHRSADPLKASKEEFQPAKGLCLLDIEPRHPLPYPTTVPQRTSSPVLTTTLWQNRWGNLKVLDQIAPGAFDAVTPEVPSLRDPTRGGERDLRHLPICRLTPEMAHGLTKAWFEWPFRPNLAELIHKGSVYEGSDDSGAMPRN
ncbi:MAG: hypothetical protein Q9224_001131 [Gallowayella concinna]